MTIQPMLFPDMPDDDGVRAFSVYGAKTVPNYKRRRNGRPQKIMIRSPERGGRIVATVYTGEADAEFIVRAVNAMYESERR